MREVCFCQYSATHDILESRVAVSKREKKKECLNAVPEGMKLR